MSETPIRCISKSRDKNKAPDDQNGLSFRKINRKRGPMDVFKAALFVLRLKSSKSKSKANEVSKFSWKRLVGSMRPMHLQSNQSPTPAFEAKPTKPESITVGVGRRQQIKEPITVPFSPMKDASTRSPAFSISSDGSTSDLSQYESPNSSLHQEINDRKPCGEITEEEGYDEDGGDEMIDAKAEEFIAHFYEQMRLQNLK
ncbi:hypothetical protein PTKIN_Ptkin15bG0090700 [Pterospermum kingtungense]